MATYLPSNSECVRSPVHLKVLHSPERIMDRSKMTLRRSVCRVCADRPPGSETLDSSIPRTCEERCLLFRHLRQLLRSAYCVEPMVGSFDQVMRAHLERLADVAASPRASRPGWSRHNKAIVGELKKLIDHG